MRFLCAFGGGRGVSWTFMAFGFRPERLQSPCADCIFEVQRQPWFRGCNLGVCAASAGSFSLFLVLACVRDTNNPTVMQASRPKARNPVSYFANGGALNFLAFHILSILESLGEL